MSGEAPVARTWVARPWTPPLLDAETASLMNVLSAIRRLGDVSGLAVRTEAPGEVFEPVAIGFTLGGAPACAAMPAALLRRLLDALDPAAPDAGGAWPGLLLELALEEALEQLERLASFLTVRTVETPPPLGDDAVAIGLAMGAYRLRVGLSADAARLAASVLERIPPLRTRRPGLAVAVSLRVMATSLPLAAVRRLVPGDVVMADALADGGVLVIAGERIGWQAVRDGLRVQVTSMARRAASAGWKDWLLVDENEEQGDEREDGGSEGLLDGLPVRIGFELGRLELTLAELEAIGPGHVFDLARQEADAVDIVANGRRIGRGRIVQVAGTLGVQVVQVVRIAG